jgi:hypothetical protein
MIRIIDKNIIAMILIGSIGFLLFAPIVRAQVVINEFQPKPNPEWIEFYNVTNEDINLGDYFFDDDTDFNLDNSNSSKFALRGILAPKSLCYWEVNSFLNDGGDSPTLFTANGDIIDTYTYTSSSTGLTYSRIPDGEAWQINSTSTKSEVACINLPTPISTPTSLPTLSPSPSPTQILSKAKYKINKAKDDSGSDLTGVQIFVDGQYIHHEDDEILEFYQGNECYSGVSCGLGMHTVSLRKSGYNNWEDTRDFTAGLSLEINPILDKQSTPSPTTSPTSSPTKTPTPKPTASPKVSSPTPGSLVEENFEATDGAGVLGMGDEASSVGAEKKEDGQSRFPLIALGLTALGVLFIGLSIFVFSKTVKRSYTSKNEDSDSQIS